MEGPRARKDNENSVKKGKEGNTEIYGVRRKDGREGRRQERSYGSAWGRAALRIGDAGRGKCFLSHNA